MASVHRRLSVVPTALAATLCVAATGFAGAARAEGQEGAHPAPQQGAQAGAAAEPHEGAHAEAPGGAEEPSRAFVFGGFGTAVIELPSTGGSDSHFGGGVFAELPILHHMFEVELAGALLANHGYVDVPVDLVLKKPFELDCGLVPFVGIGPAMVASTVPDSSVHFGGTGVVGSYYWFTPQMGVLASASYTALSDSGTLVSEIGFKVGVAYGLLGGGH